MTQESFAYTGCENLEAMAEAVNYNKYLVRMIKASLVGPRPRVLDFGAGAGTYADMLEAEGVVVDCLEPDRTLQGLLTSKGFAVVPGAEALTPDSYDAIYALNVLEHIEDDAAAFTSLVRTLRPHGRLIIYVPAFQSIFSSMDELVGHYRRYRKPGLRRLAQDNNMQIVRLHYCDPVGYAAALAFKASRNKSGVISTRSVKAYDRIAFPVSRAVEPVFKHAFGKNAILVAQKTA